MAFVGDVIAFLTEAANWSGPGGIPSRLWEHTWLSVVSVVAAAAIMLPIAVWLGHTGRGTVTVSAVVNVGRALPSFGILAIMLIVTIDLGLGLGVWPAFIALFALAAPPIFTNAVTGVQEVDRGVVESARGMGMTERQVLTTVELPLATPLILEGTRIALVQVIATATLAALVAWGGLGRFIIDGFAQRDFAEVFVGGLLVALMAVAADALFSRLERWGARHGARTAMPG
jgi:osmoprotectant transport system permease protein